MKKLLTLFACSMALTVQVQAQTCCGASTTAPEVTTGFYTTTQIGRTSNTPAPTLATSASTDLPTVEYLVTKRNRAALDGTGVPDTTGGGGDVIVGADADGIFAPADMGRYGVNLYWGDTFDITAVGYDLGVIQNLADSLLNGMNSGGRPCCSLFPILASVVGEPAIAGFCDSMNNAGIYGSSNINGMNEVLEIFDVFTEGELSIGSITSTLELINANGNRIGTDCGGTGVINFLSYGISRSAKYGYDVEGTIAVQRLSDVSRFMVFPNPANGDQVQVYFTTDQVVDLNINVVNMTGQTVYQTTLGQVHGNTNVSLPVAELPAGIYTIELTDGHSNQTQQLVVR